MITIILPLTLIYIILYRADEMLIDAPFLLVELSSISPPLTGLACTNILALKFCEKNTAHHSRLDGKFQDATASLLEGIASSTKDFQQRCRHADTVMCTFMWSCNTLIYDVIYARCKI